MPVSAQSRPVDLVHLARYTGGDIALNAEVLDLFRNQSAELMTRLQSVIETCDAKDWRHITHSLKGAARGIGAFALADAAAAAEPVDVSDTKIALEKLQAMKLEAHAVQLFIQAYLGR